jgi:uncharacterized protein (TIGR02444 family)
MGKPKQKLNLNNELWRFSLAVYAQPGVEPLCLKLQDQHRVNINILLSNAWLFSQQRHLSPNQWQTLATTIAPFTEVIDRIRMHRRQLKSNPHQNRRQDQLRNQVKALELLAEQYQQATIASWLSANPAAGNGDWHRFCAHFNIAQFEQDLANCLTLTSPH